MKPVRCAGYTNTYSNTFLFSCSGLSDFRKSWIKEERRARRTWLKVKKLLLQWEAWCIVAFHCEIINLGHNTDSVHCSSSSAFYLGEGVSILAHIPQISLCLSFSFHSDRNKSHFMPSKPTWPIHHEHAGSELHSHPRVSRNALSYCNQNILARKCKLSEWRDTTRSGGRGTTTSSHIAP